MPRAIRRCGREGCDNPMPCQVHKPVDRRPSSRARGYDRAHERARAEWAPIVATGTVKCRRTTNGTCTAASPFIRPGEPWHLGHPDIECPAPRAPEHRGCNTATGGREERRRA